MGGRLLSFEFKNPWRILLDSSLNSNPLGAQTRIPAGVQTTLRPPPADEFFKKPDTIMNCALFGHGLESTSRKNTDVRIVLYKIWRSFPPLEPGIPPKTKF